METGVSSEGAAASRQADCKIPLRSLNSAGFNFLSARKSSDFARLAIFLGKQLPCNLFLQLEGTIMRLVLFNFLVLVASAVQAEPSKFILANLTEDLPAAGKSEKPKTRLF